MKKPLKETNYNEDIYEPEQDSYLLEEAVKEYLANLIDNNISNKTVKNKLINKKNIKILDMGTGSGIQAKACIDLGFKNILAVDINKQAIKLLKKHKIKAIQSNLFSKISKKQKFDLILFNPPYLPEDVLEPESSKVITTAGKKGYELIIRFLKQAKSHIAENGAILLLFSSLSQPAIIKKQAKQLGYKLTEVSTKNLFFETLFVYKISLK